MIYTLDACRRLLMLICYMCPCTGSCTIFYHFGTRHWTCTAMLPLQLNWGRASSFHKGAHVTQLHDKVISFPCGSVGLMIATWTLVFSWHLICTSSDLFDIDVVFPYMFLRQSTSSSSMSKYTLWVSAMKPVTHSVQLQTFLVSSFKKNGHILQVNELIDFWGNDCGGFLNRQEITDGPSNCREHCDRYLCYACTMT